MKKSISIIIPVFNEKENVEEIVKALQEVFPKLDYDCSITFIDDGSDDGTLEILRQQSILCNNIFLFRYQEILVIKMPLKLHWITVAAIA